MWDIETLQNKYTPFQIQKLLNHKPIIDVCPICAERFDAQSYTFRPTAIYPHINVTCSPKCKRVYAGRKNKTIFKSYICKGCNNQFLPHPGKPHQQFCNKTCRGIFLQGKKRPEMQRWMHKIQPPKNSISKQGTLWLSQFSMTHREHLIEIHNTKYRVDGYDERTNTIYEFFGSFWHGNPNVYNPSNIHPVCKVSFQELYAKTVARIKLFEQSGYNVVYEWSKK